MLRDFKDAGDATGRIPVTPWSYKYWLRLMERHAQGLDLWAENTPTRSTLHLMDDESRPCWWGCSPCA